MFDMRAALAKLLGNPIQKAPIRINQIGKHSRGHTRMSARRYHAKKKAARKIEAQSRRINRGKS